MVVSSEVVSDQSFALAVLFLHRNVDKDLPKNNSIIPIMLGGSNV